MDLHRTQSGRWILRWREGGRRRSKTFEQKNWAEKFEIDRLKRKQLGQAMVAEDVLLNEFVETYWQLHAVPNLAASTRDFYGRTWAKHIRPRLGGYGIRELTPPRLARFREDLERAGIGTATVRKTLAVVQSILSFAQAEGLIEFNAAASVRKPRYVRAREPRIFLPAQVEEIRGRCDELRDRTLISVLAYSGPRPEEVVCRLTWADVQERTIRYLGTKKGGKERYTPLLGPLADDLREWRLASGMPVPKTPVFPNHADDFWSHWDWANWRNRIWKGGCGPDGSRPRDLRSSFITVQVYAGTPLTTISKWCGTGVGMLERHYAGLIEDFSGVQVPAEDQIRQAREQLRERAGRWSEVTIEPNL